MSALMMLIPPEYAVFLFVAAGLAIILQAKRLGAALFVGGVAIILLPALLGPLPEILPLWVLLLLMIALGFSLIRAVLNLLFGRGVADHALGTLLADLIRFLIFLPFRLVRGLLTIFSRRGVR